MDGCCSRVQGIACCISLVLINQSSETEPNATLVAMASDFQHRQFALKPLKLVRVIEPRLLNGALHEGSVVVTVISTAVHEALGVVARRYAAQLNNLSGSTEPLATTKSMNEG
jgi:hypothetical protein